MIHINDHEISLINIGDRTILSIYKGDKMVWSAINSCFGIYNGEKVWKNDDTWKNN